jgi:hypothetical protein
MAELGATYVIADGGADCPFPVNFAASPLFEPAFANGSVTIYRLSSAP